MSHNAEVATDGGERKKERGITIDRERRDI
jgi:hypothetical protein